MMRMAMTGNPNSGKTTMFNALTGRHERVGNWAGVTVDRKEWPVKKRFYKGEGELVAVDLPGAYSMSPFTSEESITRAYVQREHPDVIVNVVDAANLSRSLFFTTQLLELGIPVVIALNKSDINEKKQTKIDEKALEEEWGCPVIKTVSTSEEGLAEVIRAVVLQAGKTQRAPYIQEEINLTDKKAVQAADEKRFEFVKKTVAGIEERKVFAKDKSRDDVLDEFLTHPVLGIMIFAGMMWLVFYISQEAVGGRLSELLAGSIGDFQGWAAEKVQVTSPILRAVLIDGIIGGVGAVVGFLPLVMVLYFLIALLEDCGYMARVAVLFDPAFKRVGLSGKSVIPMIMGTGCGVPAIMACRTIRNERERRATAMLCTFMPCGAKLPVIALFSGAFFPGSVWIGPAMYFTGILLIFLGALLIMLMTGTKYRKSFFIIELPEYRRPSLALACRSMAERGKAYIVKAGTIILVCNTVVQMMSILTPDLKVAAADGSDSVLAMVAAPFAVVLIPIVGFSCWQCAAAAITGFIAKENVVGTLATVFCITNFIDTEELALVSGAGEVATVMGLTKAAALGYLMFNLFTPPCFAALGALHAEMKSLRWMAGAIGFQLGTGYTVGYLISQGGTWLATGAPGQGWAGGLAVIPGMGAFVVFLYIKAKQRVKEEYIVLR